jgi:hypothetical protein
MEMVLCFGKENPPTKKAIPPTKRENSPTKKAIPPTNRENSPTNRVNSPTNREKPSENEIGHITSYMKLSNGLVTWAYSNGEKYSYFSATEKSSSIASHM